jgi:hypothetical protein
MSLTNLAMQLLALAEGVAFPAMQLISHYEANPPRSAAAAAALGFWNPEELRELSLLCPSMYAAASRWLWQAGEVHRVSHEILASIKEDLFSDPPMPQVMVQIGIVNGLMPASAQPIDNLVALLNQEKQRQRPKAGMELAMRAMTAALSGGDDAAGTAVMSRAGDPQEQRLYQLFPGWLDQLVSQVTGRRVTLAIEPEAAHDLERPDKLACQLFL